MGARYIVLSHILQAEQSLVKFSRQIFMSTAKESGILVQSQTNFVSISYFQKQNKLIN